MTWFALGWTAGGLTGWGTFGTGFARGLHEAGYEVKLVGGVDPAGVLPLDRPLIESLQAPLPEDSPGWLFVPLGNNLEARPDVPSNVKVCGLSVFEDPGALDAEAVERLKAYELLIAPSRWVQGVLAEKGLSSTLCYQGFDGRVFFPNHARPTPTRPLVFSGGKLEFRKGQDITVEAFKRFRSTPEGKDAVLVTAWHNPWPQTMDGIWLSGYVKGVPKVQHGRADIPGWLEVNGIPRDAVIDVGPLSPPELAHVMRSCTVGVFPSRAEGATNLVLVEALATGLPCIASSGHGHADVFGYHVGGVMRGGRTVPAGCRLYRSTDGWSETHPDDIAEALLKSQSFGVADSPSWDWRVKGPKFADACALADLQAAPIEVSVGASVTGSLPR